MESNGNNNHGKLTETRSLGESDTYERKGRKMYIIETDGEGIIGMYDCREDAERMVWEYEQADRANGVYTEDYYKIRED